MSMSTNMGSTGVRRAAIAVLLTLAAAPATASEWQHEITPYLWASGMDGTVAAGPVRTNVDAGFDAITDNLEMGFMGAYRATRDRWSFMADAMYMGLGATAKSGRGFVSADVDVDQTSIETAVGYAANENVTLVGGLRYVDLTTKLQVDGLVRGTTLRESHTWVDPLLGVVLSAPLGERWSLSMRTDVGGFGIGSELTWQVALAARYRVSDTVTIVGALRRIDTRYEDGDFRYDVAASGPGLGVTVRF
jgi:hypothetical protein